MHKVTEYEANSRIGGAKFRGVSEIGAGGVIRLRQTYLGPHVG